MPTNIDHPFSPALLNALSANPRITSLINAIPLERITASDKPIIDELNRSVLSYLQADPVLAQEWRDSSTLLDSLIKWGFPTDARVLAAAILSGAAISLPQLSLRNDVHPSLLEARNAFQHCLANNIDPRAPGSPVLNLHPTIITRQGAPSVVIELANAFNVLAQGPSLVAGYPNGLKTSSNTFHAAIRVLLEGNSPLRVGLGLHTLDVNSIDAELEKRFRQGFSSRVVRQPIGDDSHKVRPSYARAKSVLKLQSSRCDRRQEESSDEIFWVGYHFSLKNLVEVYDQIDAALQRGSAADLSLNFDWQVKAWQSPLFGGIHENSTQVLNTELGSAELYNGFGPWTASLACVEDDDHEYDVISGTANTVGNYAQVISQTAGTVAAISGPSPMAAAAGAISSAAAFVDLCCDITQAVVDIANFFDEDDVIGFTSFTGRGDYAQDRINSKIPMEVQDFPLGTAGNRSRGGCYEIQASEVLSGFSRFERDWRFRQFRVDGKKYHRNPDMGCMGCSGEVDVEITLPMPADVLLPSDVTSVPDNKNGHAEWVKGPSFKGDRIHVSGQVHYGTRSTHSIDFTPWVLAVSFTKPRDEQFSTHRTVH